MSKTRAKDRILLSTGRTLTLAEALDEGLVALRQVDDFDRVREDERGRPKRITRYLAGETDGDLFWEVSRTFYESRSGLPVTAGRKVT